MQGLIESIRDQDDSIGGIIRGVIRNMPVGLGEPAFDKLPALLAHAMLSINAVKGFDIGAGFNSIQMKGSEHNDIFIKNKDSRVSFQTNNAGGTLGGISNGADVIFRVAFKPVSTIAKTQKTLSADFNSAELSAKGRHDPCVLPRAVPIVDAMAALVIMDLYLMQQAYK
jgi:chorismate synthase